MPQNRAERNVGRSRRNGGRRNGVGKTEIGRGGGKGLKDRGTGREEDEEEEEEGWKREGEERGERDAPRANSLLASSARGAMPNPGGTAYIPFSRPPVRRARCTLPPSGRGFSHPFPASESFRDTCLSLPLVSHSLARCTKLQFIAISLAPIRPSLLPPLLFVSHPGFLTPHRRGGRDTHQLRHSRVPSSLRTSPSPVLREYSHGCFPPSSPTLRPSLSFSPSRVPCCAVGRSARRSAATGVANSLFATSASLGRFRAPAGRFASMRRAALPASCT